MSTNSSQLLHVFLCHSSEDKPSVRILYHLLRTEGFEPWLDEEQLTGGEEWELEIRNVMRSCHIVIVCISNSSVTKVGFIQKEIRYALDVSEEQPEGTIFLIPLKLEPCNVPEQLKKWNWINLYDEKGYPRLLNALRKKANLLGLRVRTGESAPDVAKLFRSEKSDLHTLDPKSGLIGEIFGLNYEGKFEESKHKLDSYLAAYPNDYEILYYYSFDLLETYRKYDILIRFLDLTLPEIQDNLMTGRLLKHKGLALLRRWYKGRGSQSDLQKAKEDLLLSVKLNPNLSESYLHLALIYGHQGNLPEVDIYFEHAIRTSTEAEMTMAINKIRNDARVNPSKFLLMVKEFYR